MDAVFSRLIQISGEGSVIVLAVLLLRLVLRKAPRRTMCLLWMLAVLRLLMPFRIESGWSLQPELPETVFRPTVQVDHFDSSGTVQTTVIPQIPEDPVEYLLQTPPEPEKNADPMAVLAWVWLIGLIGLMIHGIVSYLLLKRRVRDAIVLEEGVWVSPGLDTAFVLGFFRPQVYLPVLPAEERELVLLHERCHIRRLDHWWKLAAYCAVSVHWFNPLAWVTYVLMCRDMELACDQETVKGMDNEKRKAYSAALLNCAVKRSGIAACPVAFGEISVKERIKMVLNYKKPRFWVTIVALIAAISVGFFLLTSPKELTDLEKCEQALKQWQGMESIQLYISSAHEGDLALNSWAKTEYWASGGNALELVIIDDHNYTMNWRALRDGKVYVNFTWEEAGDTISTGWEADPNSQQWNIPWVLNQDWSSWQFTHLHTAATELGEDIYLEASHPEKDAFVMIFSFEEETLKRIQRTFTNVQEDEREEDGMLASRTVQTFTLMETDQEKIEEQMKINSPRPELVQLYSQLEDLQSRASVHLVIDQEIDGDYEGWDTCRQDFLISDKMWYRKFDNQTKYGTIVTRYLSYGGKVYATEHSDAGLVPTRGWEQIENKGFNLPNMLTQDWRAMEVLDVKRNADGTTVITIQADLTPTEDTTYYSKTYEFHLNQAGVLTTHVIRYHMEKDISDQGKFEIMGVDIVHILDTDAEEIKNQILAVKDEMINKKPRA